MNAVENSNSVIAVRFSRTILFVATIICSVANANICEFLTLNHKSEKTAIRQHYSDLGAAANRIEQGGIMQSLFYARNDRVVLRAFFDGNLKKLNDLVEIKIPTVTNPRVREAYEKLKRLNAMVLGNTILKLSQFNRLAFLYAQLLDLLDGKELSNRLKTHDQSYSYETSRGRPVLSLMESSENELLSWIENGVLNPIAMSSGLSAIYPASKGWTPLPTFASLSFRTILWAISRGIFFIGQTGDTELVDGSRYSPSLFSSHDYVHGAILMGRPYNPASRIFWDQIENALDSAGHSPKLLKIHEGILFFAFHEYTKYEMNCRKLKPRFAELRGQLVGDLNLGELEKRFNDKSDFGQAFQEPVTNAELKRAIENSLSLITRICLPLREVREDLLKEKFNEQL